MLSSPVQTSTPIARLVLDNFKYLGKDNHRAGSFLSPNLFLNQQLTVAIEKVAVDFINSVQANPNLDAILTSIDSAIDEVQNLRNQATRNDVYTKQCIGRNGSGMRFMDTYHVKGYEIGYKNSLFEKNMLQVIYAIQRELSSQSGISAPLVSASINISLQEKDRLNTLCNTLIININNYSPARRDYDKYVEE